MFQKKLAATFAVAGLIMSMLSTQALAATTPTSAKNIELNGQSINKPAGLVHDGTTYMPIFYLNEVLTKLGITLATKWDGKTWALQTPSYMAPNMGNVKVGSGNVTITLNGTPIQKVNSVVAVDPASGVDTTYLPIWYLEQVLGRLGVTDDWNGTVWNLKTNLNYVGKPYNDILQYMDTTWANLDASSDPNTVDEALYHEGYITSNFLTWDEQNNTNTSWSTFVQQYSISKVRLALFHVNPYYEQLTSTKAQIPTSDVATIYYTNGDEQYVSTNQVWTLLPSAQGIWQVDSEQDLNQQSSSSGNSSGSGSTANGTGSGSSGTGSATNNTSGTSNTSTSANSSTNTPSTTSNNNA